MKAKNENGLAGFCLGFFLGVLGLVIIWRISKRAPSEIRDLAPGWMSRGTENAP